MHIRIGHIVSLEASIAEMQSTSSVVGVPQLVAIVTTLIWLHLQGCNVTASRFYEFHNSNEDSNLLYHSIGVSSFYLLRYLRIDLVAVEWFCSD